MKPALPPARGPISARLIEALRDRPGSPARLPSGPEPADEMALADDDTQLSLYICYELGYRGFDGVAEGWEWDPVQLGLRRILEHRFESALRRAVPGPGPGVDARTELTAMASGNASPSLSEHMEERGSLEWARELAVHRSAYQLKEADPHTWAIPRLSGRSKATMVRLQVDEYGGGDAAGMHSSLFADSMRALGLDSSYGAYLDLIPGVTLATVNLVSMLGLHRRLRGALVGHLALFEMTSVVPMARYSRAMRRLGLGPSASRFYDAHVVADAEHERIALDEMVAGLVEQDPELGPDVVMGARWLGALEGRVSAHILDAWRRGHTSLVEPLRITAAA